MAQLPKKKTPDSILSKPDAADAAGAASQPQTGRAPTPAGGQSIRQSPGTGSSAPESKRGSSASQIPAARPRSGMAASTGRQTPVSNRAAGKRTTATSIPAKPESVSDATQLRGLPLALKFSVPISLLVVVAMSLFGYLATQSTETQLNDEIVNSGYGQVQALQSFAQIVMADYRGRDSKEEYDKKFKTHRDFVQNILARNPRIYDIVIYASTQTGPMEVPDGVVLQGRDGTRFTRPPKEHIPVNLPNADPAVMVYRGKYVVKSADGEHEEPSLYFRIPIREGTQESDPTKMFSSLNVIMSAKEIRDELSKMKRTLLMLGLFLTLTSVGVALALARYTVRPIKELVKDMNAVAQGELEHQSPVAETSTDEVGLLATAFNLMTTSLRAGRESERENQRISGELNTAKSIHIKLMPEKLPQLPGIDIFTAYQSAKEVGGDYYDFIPVGDADHLALCVADVSGKGIPGSMVMGTTRTILRMMAVGNHSPAEVLAKTNFHVARDIKRGMFVTCVYCILNVRTREMSVASAGHNPMLIFRAATGKVEKIRPNGIALGFDKGPVFNKTIREERIQLEKGDRVVLYTDGVVEAMNEERVEWSDEALDAFVLKNSELSSKEFVRLLIKALDDHKGAAEQHDDITVTTFRVMV